MPFCSWKNPEEDYSCYLWGSTHCCVTSTPKFGFPHLSWASWVHICSYYFPEDFTIRFCSVTYQNAARLSYFTCIDMSYISLLHFKFLEWRRMNILCFSLFLQLLLQWFKSYRTRDLLAIIKKDNSKIILMLFIVKL